MTKGFIVFLIVFAILFLGISAIPGVDFTSMMIGYCFGALAIVFMMAKGWINSG